MTSVFDLVDQLACRALTRELALEGKPGLVTPNANGSHADMDFHSFRASIGALTGYFGDCARLGAERCRFDALQARGLVAEGAMFAATGGVNTHKGAIFTLGLLAAAAGNQFADEGALEPALLGERVARCWGAEILLAGARPGAAYHATHGAHLRARLGLPGAREQAAAGFPVLFAHTVPHLRHAFACGASADTAALHALLATIAVLPDTNLAHRGGADGLHWAQQAAAGFIASGGVFSPDWEEALDVLGAAFVARWLSPGGSADLLAAAYFVNSLPPRTQRVSMSAAHECVTA